MLLPPCPLRLKASFVWKYQLGGVALLIVGLASAIGYAWWQYDAVKELIDQDRIWQAGVPALGSEVSGRVTTNKFIFHGYDLDVKYLDADRTRHESKLEFDTLGVEVDQAVTPTVRYLKDDSSRFALSWAIEVKISRWFSIGFMAIAGIGLIGGSFTYLGVLALRRLGDARRCASRSDEVLVRITRITQQIVKGRHTGNEYLYAGQTVDGRAVSGKVIFPVKHEPLYVDSTKQTMIVLVPQENLKRVVVLRGDFHPLDLTPDEQAKVRAGMAGRSPAGS
jgi:hypothetical protein